LSEIVISTLEKAVSDGISLLTRTRFHTKAPFYLTPPHKPLVVTVLSVSERLTAGLREMVVEVRCVTWNNTVVTFTLSEKYGYWLVWGQFTISYDAVGYPVMSLRGRAVNTKSIYPAFAQRDDYARPLELRIRSRAR